jgi:hypothetical protein
MLRGARLTSRLNQSARCERKDLPENILFDLARNIPRKPCRLLTTIREQKDLSAPIWKFSCLFADGRLSIELRFYEISKRRFPFR